MWSSRIFSLGARASSSSSSSARFTSCTTCPQNPIKALRSRTFVNPSIATTLDGGYCVAHNSSGCNNIIGIRSTGMPSTSNNLQQQPFHETRRFMSKYLSKSATKRLPLNTKRAGKGYYKGKGGTSEGRLTSKGKFIADPLKKLQLIVPDLTDFPLKPYIARSVSRRPPEVKAITDGKQ